MKRIDVSKANELLKEINDMSTLLRRLQDDTYSFNLKYADNDNECGIKGNIVLQKDSFITNLLKATLPKHIEELEKELEIL